MNSKTTFWGQVGALASTLQAVGAPGAIVINDEKTKRIFAIVAFIGFALGGYSKKMAGIAAADAEPGEKKIEAAKVEVAKAEDQKLP